MKKLWYIFIALGFIIGLTTSSLINATAQSTPIPKWIKNTALWWGQSQISDDEFIKAIQFLIDQKILVVKQTNNTKQLQDKIAPNVTKNSENKTTTPPLDVTKNLQNKTTTSTLVRMTSPCTYYMPSTEDTSQDYGYIEYEITLQNLDKISHTATIRISDLAAGGTVISSKEVQVSVLPEESTQVTETIQKTALSDGLCHAELIGVK